MPSWKDGAVMRFVTSVDHKRVGILYLLAAALFLAGAAVCRLLYFIEVLDPAGGLSNFATLQVVSFQATVLLFGFGLPLTLGLAVYLLPLQIGARSIAWPRLNAFAFWLYLGGVSLMLVAFAAGDPSAESAAIPLSSDGQQHWILGFLLVCVAVVTAALVLLQTVRTRRAEGLTLARVPIFTAASALYAGALIVGMTISGVAAATFLIDAGAAQSFFVYDTGEGFAFYQSPGWAFTHPVVYAQLVPVIGMVSEALATGRRAPRARSLALAAAAAAAALATLAGFYHLVAEPLGDTFARGFTLSGFVLLGAFVPAVLAWLGGLRGLRLPLDPLPALVLGMLALLGIGTVLGFALGFPGDYKAGASNGFHQVAYFDGMLGSVGLLGAAAGVLYWFPKLTGRRFDLRLARAATGLLALGSLCILIGFHILGESDLAGWTSGAKAGSSLALAGYLLAFLGGGLFVAGVAASLRAGRRVGNDPWLADTLEWLTTSPPPAHNFDSVPEIASPTPLADLRIRLESRR